MYRQEYGRIPAVVYKHIVFSIIQLSIIVIKSYLVMF